MVLNFLNSLKGSAKRDIVRKPKKGENVAGGAGGIGKKNGAAGRLVDDGSTYEDAAYLNDEDPNYDSEVISISLFQSFLLAYIFVCSSVLNFIYSTTTGRIGSWVHSRSPKL